MLNNSTSPAILPMQCYMPCLSHGSLFSGIGGFDLAAQWMGWTNVFQCEKDDWCRKVLAKNFPETERFADIKEFDATKYNGTIDIISGGFPCQPFSVAGQRKGKQDDRYLWEEMLRVIGEVKPTYVVGENVTGIIGLALDTVLSDLEAQGYTTETFIIPACGKNAWHRRDRVWIVAYANSIRWQDEQKENREFIHNGKRNGSAKEQSREQQQRRISEPSIVSANTDNTGCKEQRQSITNGKELFAPKCSSWWKTEPGICRVVDGLPKKLDKNLIEYEKSNYKKTFTEVDFVRWQILRNVWNNRKFTKASPRLQFRGSENSLSKVPYLYSLEGEELGKRIEEDKKLCSMWERIYSKPLKETQDLQLEMLIRIREAERSKEMEKRVDRLKGLGNAIVPQVAYEIFSAIGTVSKALRITLKHL